MKKNFYLQFTILILLISFITINFLNINNTYFYKDSILEENKENDDDIVSEEKIVENNNTNENNVVEETKEIIIDNYQSDIIPTPNINDSIESNPSNNDSANKDTDNIIIDTKKEQNIENEIKETPICKPKTFDFSFVRADFDSLEKCQEQGNLYTGYGYFCDYFPDDCGTYYYMLTLFDSSGNHYDYHEIEIPE